MTKSNDAVTPTGKSSVVSDTADQMRDRAGDAAEALKGVGAKASSTAQEMNDKAAGLLGTAKGMASDAGGKVNDALEDHKMAGAERVKGISGAIRRAADELADELPPAATYIRRAADEIDSMADAVQRRDVRQLVDELQGFARRQPAAFLGATVLVGFAIMRLLKAPTAAQASGAASGPSSSTEASASTGELSALEESSGAGGVDAEGFERSSRPASAGTGKRTRATRS